MEASQSLMETYTASEAGKVLRVAAVRSQTWAIPTAWKPCGKPTVSRDMSNSSRYPSAFGRVYRTFYVRLGAVVYKMLDMDFQERPFLAVR